jgi:hypothetical protein
MRIGSLALVVLPLAVLSPPAIAQPMDEPAGDEDQYDDAAPGEAVDNVDVFYDRLADDGTWVDEPNIGHVFIPERANFVPYQNGYWKRTSVGFVWVSDEPFAWATTHYGRWAYSSPYNRWVWLPDTTWGPSWVDWRDSGDHIGWAPLAPEIVIRTGYVTPVEYFHYAPGARILDVNLVRYYEPRERIVVYHRDARPMVHYATIGGARVVVGPPAVRLRAVGYTPAQIRPVRVDARYSGRMSATEYKAAVVRAHDPARQQIVEQRNVKRIEANPHIQQVHAQATVKWGSGGGVHPAPAGQPGHTVPGHIEPPPTHTTNPGGTYGGPTHTAPPPTNTGTYGGPTHTAPPPTHTAPPPTNTGTYGGPTHTAPPPTNTGTYGGPTHTAPPPTHTAPPPTNTGTYGGPTHTAPPPTTHNTPPPTNTGSYGGPTHTAPPPTHTAPPPTNTGSYNGGSHSSPPPSRPPPSKTPPTTTKDPKKH